MIGTENGKAVGSHLVGSVSVGSNAVSPYNDGINVFSFITHPAILSEIRLQGM